MKIEIWLENVLWKRYPVNRESQVQAEKGVPKTADKLKSASFIFCLKYSFSEFGSHVEGLKQYFDQKRRRSLLLAPKYIWPEEGEMTDHWLEWAFTN